MKEQKLFKLLKEKLIPDLEKTDQYSYNDATSKQYNSTIELKCRKSNHRFLIIEKIKYDKLIKNQNPIYINSMPVYPYQDTYAVYSWNLSKIPEPRWEEKWCKKTTEFGPEKYEKKLVGMLDINIAKNLTNKLFN